MIRAALTMSLLLGGCASVTDRAGGGCKADAAAALVGETANRNTVDRAKKLSRARTVRVVAPGDMVTMDYRTDRLNVKTDAANQIVAVTCG